MTQVTAVDAYWLGKYLGIFFESSQADGHVSAELGSVFYSVKEKNFDERGNRRTADKEFSKRAELETEMARQREEFVINYQPHSDVSTDYILLVQVSERGSGRGSGD